MNLSLIRTQVSILWNNSGADVAQGDIVIIDTSQATSFDTTTTAQYKDGFIGVVIDNNGIADGDKGLVAFGGTVPKINLNTSATIGQVISTHTVAGQGTPNDAPLKAGDFAVALEAGTSPVCVLFGTPVQVGNISALDEKLSPVSGDYLLLEDNEDSGKYKKLDIDNLPSGGGFTAEYVGNNNIGALQESMPSNKVYAKKITISDEGILMSIGLYCVLATSDNVASLSWVLFSDNAGTPSNIIGYCFNPATSLLLDNTSGAGGTSARWLEMPCGIKLESGSYWIAILSSNNNLLQIYYDSSGADRTYVSGGAWVSDWGFYSPTTTENNYSIRGLLI
jgi:hypothetical protein